MTTLPRGSSARTSSAMKSATHTIASAERATSFATPRSTFSFARTAALSERRWAWATGESRRSATQRAPVARLTAAPTRWIEFGGDVVITTSISCSRTSRIAAGIAVRFHDTFSSGTSARRPSSRAWVESAGEALLAVQLLGGLAADRADVARPVHPGLRRHAQRLVAVDPVRVVGREDVRLDPERRQVLGQLEGTLHSSAARRGKVEADEQHLHPGDGTGGSIRARARVASRCTSRIAITPPTSIVGMNQIACIRSENAIATSPSTPTTPSAETASHW